ncbi:MAG TPA: hypothetical protein VMR70_05860 [Flavisolibacter sp.]|nr:hypothetical protein [Flavisolibacter sp.]
MQTQRAFGQDSAAKVAVVISPALFVPVSVAAQGGLQLAVSRRLSLLAEAAFPLFEPDNTTYQKIDYWRVGLEIRHRLPQKNFRRYLALQGSYLFRELTNAGGGNYYTRNQTFAYSSAHIKSPVLSTAVKLGMELPIGKRTFFDLFAGVGVRMIFNRYTTGMALVTSIEPEKQNFLKFDNAWLYNYTLVRPHFTTGLRFGVWL